MKNRFLFINILIAMMSLSLSACGNPGSNLEDALIIDIYASNDIHGQIEESGGRMNIASYCTFMKKMSTNENTLLLDQGDSWQGSIYSNYNHGALINDVMAEAHIDARTVGNHDFDWGVEYLKANTARSYNGYTVPVLAANVYDYDFINKTPGNTQQVDIGRKSVTYTLENGLKVGIVGVIGEHQITTITSSYVQDIAFINHINVIKEVANQLRNEGCDIVIATAHTGQEDLIGKGLADCVDLVLCGHTHQSETYHEGNLYYAQFGAYNYSIGHIQLAFNPKTKKVVKTDIETYDEYRINNVINGKYDANIVSIIDSYNQECYAEASTVVASNVYGTFSRGEHASNLMCNAILDEAIKEGYEDVIFSYCNNGRDSLPPYSWTYADLYETFPFDNIVYIAEIKGSDIAYEVERYNYVCFNDSFDGCYEYNKTYKIAVLDYLLYHTNEERYYDYFRSFNGEVIGQLNDNYRIILKNWLIENGYSSGNQISRNDFTSSNAKFDKDRFTQI